jgi:hypothetical protein
MKTLLKVAEKFEKRIKLASNKVYEQLVKLHDTSVGLSDLYNELAPELQRPIIALEKTTRFLADMAYRKGLTSAELEFELNKIKSTANQVAMALSAYPNPDRSQKLSGVMSVLNGIAPQDVQAQVAPTVEAPEQAGEGVAMEMPTNEGMSQRLMNVVNDLSSREDASTTSLPSREVEFPTL